MTEQNPKITVSNSPFEWDVDEGKFSFEGEDAVLFWIDSAMTSFFDTIEEISGADAASVVLETTGYRMGRIVGSFFHSNQADVKETMSLLPGVYASAGWGSIKFEDVDIVAKKAIVKMRNTWEYKVNKQQGKTQHGSFLPGHWAGVLSGLFNDNIWYEVTKSQIEGDDCCEVHYFPSIITPQQNIHELARQKEQDEIRVLEEVVEQRTKELSNLIKELSSPMLPVLDNIVVIPLLGKYDEIRSAELLEKTIDNLPKHKPKYLIIDLTGIDEHIDEHFGSFINKLTLAASLMGTDSILVGISPKLSMKITASNTNLSGIPCFSTLKHGIHHALAQEGKQIL